MALLLPKLVTRSMWMSLQCNYYAQHSHHYATTSTKQWERHVSLILASCEWVIGCFSMITLAPAWTCAVKQVLAVCVGAAVNGESELNDRIFVNNKAILSLPARLGWFFKFVHFFTESNAHVRHHVDPTHSIPLPMHLPNSSSSLLVAILRKLKGSIPITENLSFQLQLKNYGCRRHSSRLNEGFSFSRSTLIFFGTCPFYYISNLNCPYAISLLLCS